jgi:hypothetical protein
MNLTHTTKRDPLETQGAERDFFGDLLGQNDDVKDDLVEADKADELLLETLALNH